MATVGLYITDEMNRLTVRAFLERAGHVAVDSGGEVAVLDVASRAVALCGQLPVLLLTTVSGVPQAIEAMKQGVYGYVLTPFQPGELEIMVTRALGANVVETAKEDEEQLSLEVVEMRHILKTLEQCGNNQAKAARVLGIGRNTLWRKLKKRETSGHTEK